MFEVIMHVKKKRTISVKGQQLRRIRNNLRNILICAANTQWFELHNQFLSLPPDDIYNARKISGQKQELNDLISTSICKCRRCIRTDQDMTYNPRDGAWYCIECYEEMRRRTAKKKTGRSFLFP